MAANRKDITPEVRARIAAEYAAGATVRQLGVKYGTSNTVISRVIKEEGGQLRAAGTVWRKDLTPQIRAGIAKEYAAGASTCQLAAKYGLGPPAVAAIVRKAGGVMRKGYGRRRVDVDDERRSAIAADYQAGSSVPDLAAKYGVSCQLVTDAVKAARVAFRRPSHKYFSAAVAEAIVDDHRGSMTSKELCAKYRANVSSLARVLREAGLSIAAPHLRKAAWGKQPEIVVAYEAGDSTAALGERYGVTSTIIANILRDAGVPVRECWEHNQKYSVDETAFDSVTEASAYWVGMLMADGCISHDEGRSPRVRLALARRDAGHVEKFRDFLCSNHPIYPSMVYDDKYDKWRHRVALDIRSERLCSALAKFGVGPRKSLTAKVLGLEANRAMWRGAIDGDGCLHIEKGTNHPHLHFVGSFDMVTQFCDYARVVVPNCSPQPVPNRKIFQVGFGNRASYRLIRHLYKDAAVSLARKQAIADAVIANPKPSYLKGVLGWVTLPDGRRVIRDLSAPDRPLTLSGD